MSVRPAAKAGSWYSESPADLRREAERFLAAADTRGAAAIVAGIVPHAGLAYSGATAARVFAWIRATAPDIETFLIFGAVHSMPLRRPAVWTTGSWATPLGPIEVDEELAAILVAAGVGEEGERCHLQDNAIELQTPLLKAAFPKARLVAIAMPPTAAAAAAGARAWEVCRASGRKVVALGSTDLTHYGVSFNLTPAGAGPQALEWSKQNDRRLLELLLTLKAEEIVPQAERERSACGAGAAAAATAFARAAGCGQGVLLEHITSHEVIPDRGPAAHFVGYAALVFPLPEKTE